MAKHQQDIQKFIDNGGAQTSVYVELKNAEINEISFARHQVVQNNSKSRVDRDIEKLEKLKTDKNKAKIEKEIKIIEKMNKKD